MMFLASQIWFIAGAILSSVPIQPVWQTATAASDELEHDVVQARQVGDDTKQIIGKTDIWSSKSFHRRRQRNNLMTSASLYRKQY